MPMNFRGKFSLCKLLLFASACVLALFEPCRAQVMPGPTSQTTAVSGTTLYFGNGVGNRTSLYQTLPGNMTVTFEELISGSPATVSIVVQGCMRGGTCETLDTYTTVANADRSPTLSKVYDYFSVTPSWTGGASPSVTVNYSTALTGASNGGGLSGQMKGEPCIANAAGTSCISSSAWIDITPFLPGTIVANTDLCSPINAATTASAQGNAVHMEGLPRSAYCNTHWITVGGTFVGDLYSGATLFFTNAITQPLPSGVVLRGMGRTAGPNYTSVGGSAIVACSSTVNAGTDFANICSSTAYVPVKATGNGGGDTINYAALLCFSDFNCEDGNSHGAGGVGFGTKVYDFEINCSYVANCVGIENDYMQELSGLDGVEVKNWGFSNGIGISWCGGIGGCQNSYLHDLQLVNGQTTGCSLSATAVGIRIYSAGSNPAPSSLQKFSVVSNCSTGTAPNDDVEIASGTGGLHVSDGHCESYSRACIMLGVVSVMGSGTEVDTGVAANTILIESVNTGPGGVGSHIRIASAANFTGAAVTNINVLSCWQTGSAPANLVGDDNNANILAASFKNASWYVTGASGAVLFDSTGTNASNFLGAIVSSSTVTGTRLISTVATGTAPLTITSTTNVPNLNASSLNGATFAAPGAIGSGTPGTLQATTIQASTSYSLTHLWQSHTAITVSGSGLGTSPTVTANNGTATFEITTGTSPSAATFTITFPTATTGWAARCNDVTNPTTGGGINIKQTGFSTTTAVMSPMNATPALTALTASDVLICTASGF